MLWWVGGAPAGRNASRFCGGFSDCSIGMGVRRDGPVLAGEVHAADNQHYAKWRSVDQTASTLVVPRPPNTVQAPMNLVDSWTTLNGHLGSALVTSHDRGAAASADQLMGLCSEREGSLIMSQGMYQGMGVPKA